MTVSVDNVTVLGTGNLGSQIAYQTVYSGFEVMAYDINDQILETARKRFEELAARYEQEVEGASDGRARAALARMRYSSTLADAVRDADLVIESAPELLDVKRELYANSGRSRPRRRSSRQTVLRCCPATSPRRRGGPNGSSRCISRTISGFTTSRRSWVTPA